MTKRDISLKKRGRQTRIVKPVYLIIAEGKNKTEVLYFSHFRDQSKKYSIQFVKAGYSTDARSLYKTIVEKWDELDLSSDNGDKAFVVLDIDNDLNKAKKVAELMKSNKNPDIRFIVSNPAFEIWFLLHFKYTTKHYEDAEAVIKDLKKFIPDYEKNRDCYLECIDRIQKALENVEKLTKYYEEFFWPSVDCNPRTDMGDLIRWLE